MRREGRGGGEGPGKASGGISRGLEFWREFVEDGACCDRVSLGESERWEPGKLRASRSPQLSSGSETAGRLASGGRGGGDACAERCGVWPCAARSAPRWLGLQRVRAGGGGEAGGCGRECGRGRAHGARGRGPRRASPAPPPVGHTSHPAQLCSSSGRRLLARPVPPAPGALSSPAAPRYSLPPALCFTALGALSDSSRPASLYHLRSAVLRPVPLCCFPVFGTSVTCQSSDTRFLFFF